jgi:hypothetical protein
MAKGICPIDTLGGNQEKDYVIIRGIFQQHDNLMADRGLTSVTSVTRVAVSGKFIFKIG